MITITNVRSHGGGPLTPLSKYDVTIGKSLESLLRFEIGYGGIIETLHSDRLIIKTFVLACVDYTTFQGPENELKILTTAARQYAKFRHENKDQLIEAMVKNAHGSPLLITAMGPHVNEVLLGVPVSQLVALYTLKMPPEAATILLKHDTDDFWVALDLYLQGAKLEEIAP